MFVLFTGRPSKACSTIILRIIMTNASILLIEVSLSILYIIYQLNVIQQRQPSRTKSSQIIANVIIKGLQL